MSMVENIIDFILGLLTVLVAAFEVAVFTPWFWLVVIAITLMVKL